MIFFDNASTTKVDEDCREIFEDCFFENYYNPSARYHKAIEVSKKIGNARNQTIEALKGDGQIIFTSSGTESNNLALLGTKKKKNSRIIISESEHPAIMNPAMELKQRGFDVVLAPVDNTGKIIFEEYKNLIDENTSIISIMYINNETGCINDIKKLCSYAKSCNKNIIFHCDGIQAFGKVKIDLRDLNVDLFSISSHKIHSPKGTGALFVKKGIYINPVIFGGGQENNIRSSTENVAGILCLGFMAKKASLNLNQNYDKVMCIYNYIKYELGKEDFIKMISSEESSPYILAFTIKHIRGEVMLHALEKYGIMIATGSACSSHKNIIKKWKINSLPIDFQNGILRLSFSQYNTINEAEYFIKCFKMEYLNLLRYIKG